MDQLRHAVYQHQPGRHHQPVAAAGGTWYDTSSQPPASYAQADVANEALRAVAHFGYNVDANYFVVTPHGVTTSGFGTQFCAYHSSATSGSGPVSYTDLPYIPDAGTNCGQGSVNSPGTLDGVTIVGGHEEAETQTDPFPNSGWVDSTGAENGDKCAWIGLANTTLNGGTFPTQPLWSNASSSCVQSYGSPPPNGDLYAVVRAGTGSGMTEVHALNGTNFSTFTKHIATALGATGIGRGLAVPDRPVPQRRSARPLVDPQDQYRHEHHRGAHLVGGYELLDVLAAFRECA